MIRISQLSFGYRKQQTVLENLNLSLAPAHIYGLLGRNGAGKSSLLHLISGLLFPSGGTAIVAGKDPGKRGPEFLQEVYLLPEDFKLPDISIPSYINIYAPFYSLFDHGLFNRLLEEFEIPLKNSLHSMSFGQQKKVMISFALAVKAKVLLMDEPTNGLDIPSKKQFRKVIAETAADDQVIIISTHQVRDLDNLIDYVLVLEDKKIIIQESIDDITRKLVFKQVMDVTKVDDLVYSEGGLKGYAAVSINHKSELSKFDMEIFFNALLSEKGRILPLFHSHNPN